MTNLLVYDIANAKRLRDVAKTCEKFLTRVQKSVFEGELGLSQMHELKRELARIIDDETDSVMIYTVPRVAVKKKVVLGIEPDDPFVLLGGE